MYRFFQRIKLNLLTLDLLVLNVAVFASSCIINDVQWTFSMAYLPLVVFFNFLWIVLIFLKKTYDHFLFLDSTIIMQNTYKIFSAFFFCIGLFYFIISTKDATDRHYFFLFLLTSAVFGVLIVWDRIIILAFRKRFREKIKPVNNIVIFGNSGTTEKICESIVNGAVTYKILGAFTESSAETIIPPVRPLYKGNLMHCLDFLEHNVVHELFCVMGELSADQIEELMLTANNKMIRVRFLLDYEHIIKRNGKIITYFGNLPVLTTREEPLEDELNQIIKRAFDILFSIAVIIGILSWLIPVLAILIKLESRGPIFFTQKRSGKNNEPFKCFKFRSMRVNKDADQLQATKNDKRLTRLGAFLRKSNLDELPQFFNVLIGNMSIVGPRPHMLTHTEKYKSLLNSYMVRHFLKPGITGWAQVNGFRGETRALEEMEQRVQHDILYLENWSFFLDLKIIFLTVWNTIKGEEKAF